MSPNPAPEDLTSLPNPTGTEIYDGSAEVVIDTLLAAGVDAFGSEYKPTNTRLLLIQPPTTWKEVAAFYQAELPKRDWKPRTDGALGGSLGSSWQRGRQRLVVTHIASGNSDIVVLILTTQR